MLVVLPGIADTLGSRARPANASAGGRFASIRCSATHPKMTGIESPSGSDVDLPSREVHDGRDGDDGMEDAEDGVAFRAKSRTLGGSGPVGRVGPKADTRVLRKKFRVVRCDTNRAGVS